MECYRSNKLFYFQWKLNLNILCVLKLLTIIPLLATLAVIKILGYSKLDSLEARGSHLADNSARNAVLKVTSYCHGPKEYFPKL